MGSKQKKDETKRIKKADLNKKTNKTTKKGKKTKFKDKHPKAATAIKIGIIVFILLAIIGVGVLVGTFFGIFGDELKISPKELVIAMQNSTAYDVDGKEIATLSGGPKRKIISMSEMSKYLPKAYIAIEDERYESHRGVDIKRTAAATFTFLTNGGSSSFGGSTITQQLVKNLTSDDEDSGLGGVLRKVKEMAKAIQVEQYLSKDQILELYLNIIFVGGDDINGVALGSIYYFDKDAKDLSIAECAYLAGINHSPNAYKPFSDFADKEDPEKAKQEMKEKINKRVNTVLAKMKELEYITEDEYKTAKAEVEKGLNFKKGEGANVTVDISYHTEAALEQIVDQLMEEKNMEKKAAELYLYSNGLKIYTTQQSEVQAVLEEELIKETYIKPKKYTDTKTKEKITQYGMPTMVIVDHKTGQVVAAATATGDEENRTVTTKLGYLNWPTKLAKQTGSSMKPLSVIVPGIDTGTITASTMYYDCETQFPGMDRPMKNEGDYTNAPMSMRTAVGKSQNIPHAKAIMNIGVDVAIDYCTKMGIPGLGNEGVSLALGGLHTGISPMHMAMAYATIANDGTYIEPTFYTKVTDKDGNVILEAKQEKTEVFNEQTAYVVKSILKEPVTTGTATYCKIKGIDTGAKTGTTNNSYDRWLCGFTPYYTAACWYGYEHSQTVTGFGKNPAGQIWSNVMQTVHKELPNAVFEKPDGIVTANICTVSGKLAIDGQCATGYSEVFVEGTLPGNCDGHVQLPVCLETGKISTASCPTEIRSFISLPEKEQNATKWTNNYEITSMTAPTESCPVHAAPAPSAPQQPTAHTHDYKKTTSEPTCTSAGKYVYICKTCNDSYDEPSGKPINPEAHAFVNGTCKYCSAKDPNASTGSGDTTGGGAGSGDTAGNGSGDTTGGGTGSGDTTSSGTGSGDTTSSGAGSGDTTSN